MRVSLHNTFCFSGRFYTMAKVKLFFGEISLGSSVSYVQELVHKIMTRLALPATQGNLGGDDKNLRAFRGKGVSDIAHDNMAITELESSLKLVGQGAVLSR